MSLVKLDATADVLVFLTDGDIAAGIPHDCMRCAVAQGIRRMVGREDIAVEIYPTVAYITMPVDERTLKDNQRFGTPGADTLHPNDLAQVRFFVDRTCREQILHFDDTEMADPGGYRFRAMVPSQRFVTSRARPRAKNDGSRPYLSRRRAPWMRARGPIADARKA
jgi:hypothetical protein